MGDQIDYYKAVKEHYRNERDKYVETHMQEDVKRVVSLVDHAESHSEYHMALFKGESIFEYWPTTQKWMNRKTKRKGRGVDSLIKQLEEVG